MKNYVLASYLIDTIRYEGFISLDKKKVFEKGNFRVADKLIKSCDFENGILKQFSPGNNFFTLKRILIL